MLKSTALLLLSIPAVLTAQCFILYQLDDMTRCRIGHGFNVYRSYGCACSNISPHHPLDAIDKCCLQHNQCYDSLEDSEKCSNKNAPFYCLYKWNCDDDNQIVCADNSECMQSTCQCDKQFIDCLAEQPYPFFPKSCPYSNPLLFTKQPE